MIGATGGLERAARQPADYRHFARTWGPLCVPSVVMSDRSTDSPVGSKSGIAVRSLLVALALVLVAACTEDEPARTAESFCDAWDSLAAKLDVRADTFQPAEFASPAELRDLASYAPHDDLADAIENLALVQPDAIAQLDGLRDGSIGAEEYDQALVEEYRAAGEPVVLAWREMCLP